MDIAPLKSAIAEIRNDLSKAQHDAAAASHMPGGAQEPEHGVPLDRAAGVHANVLELAHAQALTPAEVGEHVVAPVVKAGSVEFFMDETTDEAGNVERFLSRVVVNAQGHLRKVRVDVAA